MSRSGVRTTRPSTANPDTLVQRVLATVDSIPAGRVATYGDVAREAGLPRRARFVGRILRGVPAASKLPWHRVVNAGGRSSLSGASAREQRRRMAREGIRLTKTGAVEAELFVWRSKPGPGPRGPSE